MDFIFGSLQTLTPVRTCIFGKTAWICHSRSPGVSCTVARHTFQHVIFWSIKSVSN